MRPLIAGVALAAGMLLAQSDVLGATGGRNCDLLFVGTGENAPYGFVGDEVEVTFCGNRRLGDADLQLFMRRYGLMLVTISAPQDQSRNAYYFRILNGSAPPEVVSKLAQDPDVRSASVNPYGRATEPSGLPNTATASAPAAPTGFMALAAVMVLTLSVLVARRAYVGDGHS